jgi:hypothetical protein
VFPRRTTELMASFRSASAAGQLIAAHPAAHSREVGYALALCGGRRGVENMQVGGKAIGPGVKIL